MLSHDEQQHSSNCCRQYCGPPKKELQICTLLLDLCMIANDDANWSGPQRTTKDCCSSAHSYSHSHVQSVYLKPHCRADFACLQLARKFISGILLQLSEAFVLSHLCTACSNFANCATDTAREYLPHIFHVPGGGRQRSQLSQVGLCCTVHGTVT